MTTRELSSEQPVRYRLGKAGESQCEWQDWTVGKLYIARRDKDLPSKLRNLCSYWRAGDITTLAVQDRSWAEFTEGDYIGGGMFMCEDYLIEIEGLV